MTSVEAPRSAAEPPVNPPAVRFEAPSEDGIGRIVIDRADDAVNAIDLDLVESLAEALHAARGCEALRGLILVSSKPDQWVAGADLKMVTQATDPKQIEAASRRFQA